MNKFYVYPKEGDRFELECGDLKVTDAGIDLRDENGEPAKYVFLSLDKIAAIVPQSQSEHGKRCFCVCLKNKSLCKVFADGFRVNGTASKITFEFYTFEFYQQNYNYRGAIRDRWPFDEVYVDLSEVVAIVPSTASASGA